MSSNHRRYDSEVAIIGAGPYGLGAAAHLKAARVDTRVFGSPMSFWRDHMPKGMNIRSAWDATHLADPDHRFTLDHYAQTSGFSRPSLLSLKDFVAYGEWFQKQAVPDVAPRIVQQIHSENDGFRLVLDDGHSSTARHVVVATGLANQEFKPSTFRQMPIELASHSADHADLGKFRDKRVAVVGRGQSACESAAILSDAGADVELIARGDVHWLGSDKTGAADAARPYWRQLRQLLEAPSGVGPFPLNWLNELPGLEHLLPQPVRSSLSRRSLRPAATAWLKPRFERVRVRSNATVVDARVRGHRIEVTLDTGIREYDHVLLATGYHIDIARLGFFGPDMLKAIAQRNGSPLLGRGFESSIPGLHFLGANAVMSYGPVMRFIAGSPFAARELTRIVAGRRATVDSGHGSMAQPSFAKAARTVSR